MRERNVVVAVQTQKDLISNEIGWFIPDREGIFRKIKGSS